MLTNTDFAAKQILIIGKGDKVSFKNDNIVVTDEEGKMLHQSSCYRLFTVLIYGYLSLTSGIIQRSKKFGFSIVLMTPTFRPYHIVSDFAEANVLLRRRQYAYEGLEAARQLTANKMKNQRALLMTCRDKTQEQQDAIRMIDGYRESLKGADGIQSIMGLEGCASRVYFKAWFDNVPWKGRKPRIKFDMVNAVLDIGYTVLFSYLDALLAVFGFDRYVGILHRQFYMRKSLVCDMVEPFRVIIDKQVKKGINLKQFQEEDFAIYDNKYCLQYKLSANYTAIFIQAINEYKDSIFLYVRDFYRAMMKDELDSKMPKWEMKGHDSD